MSELENYLKMLNGLKELSREVEIEKEFVDATGYTTVVWISVNFSGVGSKVRVWTNFNREGNLVACGTWVQP